MTRTAQTTAGGHTDAGPQHPQPTLVRLHDPQHGVASEVALTLEPGHYPVGREVGAGEGIRLCDNRASRTHASLHVVSRGLRVRVRDENSRNGTFVNGVAVEEQWLDDGDVLRFADSHFLLRLRPSNLQDSPIDSLIGRAPLMCALRATIARVAPHNITVLLTGESGTGKELVASAIHRLSAQKGPFVAVNCAAIPEQLAESQLFGHVAGAFTGAQRDHSGFFRAAEGGTLLLDEVGDLPIALQPKLLRALEQRAVVPVGATQALPYDARLLAATNVPLDQAIEEGRFRGDLYARLCEFALELPPLRQRREDVLVLFEAACEGPPPALEPALVAALLQHEWPYNVRELRAVARELTVRGLGADKLGLDMVAHRFAAATPERAAVSVSPTSTTAGIGDGPQGAPPGRDELAAILVQHKGNVRAIARHTGRSRMQVYRWVEQHGLDLNDYRDD